MVILINPLRDPIQTFLYALKAPETKRKYPQRLKFFFDFVFSDFDIKIQAREFIKKAKNDDQFVYSTFIQFIIAQNNRVQKKEITAGTREAIISNDLGQRNNSLRRRSASQWPRDKVCYGANFRIGKVNYKMVFRIEKEEVFGK